MPPPTVDAPTLVALRREIQKQRAKASLIPGLPLLLDLVELHLTATDHRLECIEARLREPRCLRP